MKETGEKRKKRTQEEKLTGTRVKTQKGEDCEWKGTRKNRDRRADNKKRRKRRECKKNEKSV